MQQRYYEPIQSSRLVNPDDHRFAQGGRDFAEPENGMPLRTLEHFLEDLRWEPTWRTDADRDCDYYDSNQLDPETIHKLEEKGLGPLIRNIIKPTIDAVLGLEERTRTDWKVVSDYDDEQDVAEALSVKLVEAERETRADNAISDAHAGQVKAGFAAVEVSRSSNPFCYPYRVEPIHRRELYWDPRSRKPDWSDARFVMRKRWFDTDVAAAYFPAHSQLIRFAAENWVGWEEVARISDFDTTSLVRSLEQERSTSISEMEWRDSARGRVCIYEVWYRVYHRGWILKLPRGRTVEFNQANPQHLAIVTAGVVEPVEAVYDKLRCAYFVGPHRVADFGSKRRRFPYIPFWGYREDLTGVPYGLIRSMVSVQDEINARLAKMMWLLSSRRTTIDADAPAVEFNTHSDLTREIARADAYIVLNPNRRNLNGALQVDENQQLADAQHRAMLDAVNAMPMVSGIYAPLMGNVSQATAASAIKQLIDQGTTTLAELNGNYMTARRAVGEALLELVREDNADISEEVTVDTGVTKRQVYINRRAKDPGTGAEIVENSVSNASVKVQLADVPNSPSYRQQQFTLLTEVAKSLSPDAQQIMVPFIIEASDLPKRREIAKLLREKMGIALDDKSPEGQAAKERAEKQAMAEAEQLAKKFDAELDEMQAKAAKLWAETDKIRTDISRSGMDEQGKAAANGELDRVRGDYESQMQQLTRQLQDEKIKAADNRMKLQADAEAREAEAREETERERIRAEATVRAAEIAAEAKKAEDKINQRIDALQAEMSDRVGEIGKKVGEKKKNDDADS